MSKNIGAIIDENGVRWVKCEKRGRFDKESAFVEYCDNYGICKNCK